MSVGLIDKYPFLKITNSIAEYIEPNYYDELLKAYIFGGKTDLDLFREYVSSLDTLPKNVLELCSGSGRVSKVAVDAMNKSNFTLSDLSVRMLAHVKNKFSQTNIKFIESDAVDFLKDTTNLYDFVYTLWGFSHSVHQHAHDAGINSTKQLLRQNLTKFIAENLTNNAKFYLVHFDSMSEEQRILMRQWKRVYNIFSDIDTQSPSKLMIDSILTELDDKNIIYLTKRHLEGDPIVYRDREELLEIFLNFHLETYFNDSPLLADVVEDIERQIEQYRQSDGSYSIRTGCYIYEITRR